MYKINIKAIVVGIVALFGFFISFYFTYKDMNIRNHGEVVRAPVSEIYTRRYMTWIKVMINDQELSAGSITTNINPEIGDSIEVSYIPYEYCVVQTSVNPSRYYIYFALGFFLLIIGLYLVVTGFAGKGLKKIPPKEPFVKMPKRERNKYLN
jgi:hypothetical protein